ncbi:MAG: TetR/AcrR family transcriptional regulator [Actinomycetota bacterium]|nr:TetR/AcrR family transcriptional regulator [Actinomycetota bacterium]MDD5668349.1 TetR/AcrR family transcriptional regulator [Actinomycetota bacterium]
MAKSLGIRRNPVKDEREAAFKQAALKVFSTKGYHRSTMSEIAMEAGFGKGTLYWYWKSKEELYFTLVKESHDEFMGVLRVASEMDANALEKLLWLGNEVAGLHYRNRDYTKLSWKMRAEESEAFSPEYVERLHRNSAEIKERLEEIISQGIREGLFPEVDAYYLACILLGLLEGIEIQWLEDPQSFDLRKALNMVVRFLESYVKLAGDLRISIDNG